MRDTKKHLYGKHQSYKFGYHLGKIYYNLTILFLGRKQGYRKLNKVGNKLEWKTWHYTKGETYADRQRNLGLLEGMYDAHDNKKRRK